MVTLAGKVAIVTGGGGGIGSGIVRELARAGARVLVNDLPRREAGTPSLAEKVVAEVLAAGGEAAASHEPVGEWDAGERLVGDAVSRYGRLDILVTCAGNFSPTPVLELKRDEWDALLAVHLTGHVSCAQAAARQMADQGEGGAIVTFASRAAFFGNTPAYSAAKAGIMGLTSALARDLAPQRVTVNCVLPSAQTPLFPGDLKSRPSSGMPKATDIDPDLIAPLVAYLASPAAADITGQFAYAAGSDICFYEQPLALASRATFLRKAGRWSLDELDQTLPPLVGAR